MRISYSARLVVCAAIAGSAGFAMVVPGGVASAKTLKVSCTSWSGDANSGFVSGCSGTGEALTGTSGTAVTSNHTTTWSTGKTSITSVTNTPKPKDKCAPPAGYTNVVEEGVKGSVTGGTSGIGGTFKATLCVFQSGSTILVKNFPGKVIKY